MFCRNCGSEMGNNAKFCSKCGTPKLVVEPQIKKTVEDNIIKFQLKPTFNMMYKIIVNSFLVLFFGAVFIVYARIFNIWIIVLPAMALVVYIKTLLDKKQHNNIEYNFYNTKVEYKDGFFNKEEKEVKYKYIREIIMSQNILERICGIGTIKIYTNASNYLYSSRNKIMETNGIYIHCVENVQEQYKKIKQIIDEGIVKED